MIAILLASVVASGASIPMNVQQAGPHLARVTRIKDFPARRGSVADRGPGYAV